MSEEYGNISRKGMIEILESEYGYCECGERIRASSTSVPCGDTYCSIKEYTCNNCG